MVQNSFVSKVRLSLKAHPNSAWPAPARRAGRTPAAGSSSTGSTASARSSLCVSLSAAASCAALKRKEKETENSACIFSLGARSAHSFDYSTPYTYVAGLSRNNFYEPFFRKVFIVIIPLTFRVFGFSYRIKK